MHRLSRKKCLAIINMTPGIVRVLVKCGALPPKKTGPSHTLPHEEAKRINAERSAAAARQRRALIREARERGEPLPVFKRGRPRKYTFEEAIEAKFAQDVQCRESYNERVKQGLANLEALYGTHEHSTDDHFFVGAN